VPFAALREASPEIHFHRGVTAGSEKTVSGRSGSCIPVFLIRPQPSGVVPEFYANFTSGRELGKRSLTGKQVFKNGPCGGVFFCGVESDSLFLWDSTELNRHLLN
jgi:hypothetical protein